MRRCRVCFLDLLCNLRQSSTFSQPDAIQLGSVVDALADMQGRASYGEGEAVS